MASIPDDPESRHARVDNRPSNGMPDSQDDTVVMTREENVVGGHTSSRLDKLLRCILSNPHPLSGRYQTCFIRTSVPGGAAGLFGDGAVSKVLKWGARILFQVIGEPPPLENTITVDGYDSNLRPTSWRIRSRLGGVSLETQLVPRDDNEDGLTDGLDLSPMGLPVTTIKPELLDTNQDGVRDYLGLPLLMLDPLGFVPLADTNGDGIPDSPALDLDGDGEPDPDLPLFTFYGGPAHPTVEQKLYFAQFGDGTAGAAHIFSEITLFNLDLQNPAQAKILLKDDGGNPLTVDLNGEVVAGEKSLVIPPGGVVSLRTDGAGPLRVGSATVCSDRAVGGVIRFGGNAGVAGVGVSHRQAQGFVASMERNEARSINSGIALMNPTSESATYTLELCDQEGQVLANAELSLAAMGHRALFVDEIDWTPKVDLRDFRGLLKARSSTPVAATVLQTRPGEFATLPVAPNFASSNGSTNVAAIDHARRPLQASSPELDQKLYFAQFGNGVTGGTSILSEFILFNLTARPARVRLSLKDDAGEPLTVVLDEETVVGEKELEIPAGGLRILKTNGAGALIVGSTTVYSDQALAGVILFGGKAGVAGVGSSALLLRGFVAPVQSRGAETISTGIAVRNVSMILRHFVSRISVASVQQSSGLGRLIQAASGKAGGTGFPLGNRSGDRAKAASKARARTCLLDSALW